MSVRKLVEASEGARFVFMSSGVEGVSHVILAAYIDCTRKTGKNHFVTSQEGERAEIMGMERLQELGCIYELAPVTEGIVSADAVAETLTPRTALVSIRWVNGLTGVVQPVEEIAKVCHERGVLFHIDVTHGLGCGYVPAVGADFVTFDGEALGGPEGTGGLFVRQHTEMSPLLIGGDEQGGLRGGPFNRLALAALEQAAEEALEMREWMCTEGVRLRDLFEERVGGHVLFREGERAPHITCIAFEGIAAEALQFLLQRKGVKSALGGGQQQRLSHLAGYSALSFTFQRGVTEERVEAMAERVNEATGHLKRYAEAV